MKVLLTWDQYYWGFNTPFLTRERISVFLFVESSHVAKISIPLFQNLISFVKFIGLHFFDISIQKSIQNYKFDINE